MKRIKDILYICIILLICLGGCGHSTKNGHENEDENQNEYNIEYGNAHIDTVVEAEKYYSVYLLTDGRYLYEIYNREGVVINREVLYAWPDITIYDSHYVEVRWGAGTGVWCCIYYDLEKCFMAGSFICSHYVKDGIVAMVAVREDGERFLHLFNPFSYSEYIQDVDVRLAPESIRVNEADCIIEISAEKDGSVRIVYVDETGEERQIVLYSVSESPAAM